MRCCVSVLTPPPCAQPTYDLCVSVCLQVRDYVLELSMDRSVCQELRTVPCERCGSDIYEARLSCTACGTAWSACAISGYPVTAAERIPHPSTAGVMLRRSDWNAWVAAFGKDPLSGGPATPQ